MVEQLLYYISRSSPFLGGLFEPPFHLASGWIDLFEGRLSGGATGVLGRMTREVGAAEPFQSLFIACWMHHPVEKGSYMIPIPRHLVEGVRSSANGLSGRWSSHLSGSLQRSAGANYRFLKGYSELLVQIETDRVTQVPYLFLKTEGHGAFSLAHLSSFVTKVRTGAGNTQSEALNRLASHPEWGITPRAAENFSKGYEGLLGNVGLKGKVIDAAQAIPAICEKLARKVALENASVWNQWLAKQAADPGATPTNVGLAKLITSVLLPTLERHKGVEGKHLSALRAARDDLARIARALEDDVEGVPDTYVPRFFGEVRVTADTLDRTLQTLRRRLRERVDEVRTLQANPGTAPR
jgi:hypothetical protein